MSEKDLKEHIYLLISKPGHNFLDDCDKNEIETIVRDVIKRASNESFPKSICTEDTKLEILIAECHYNYVYSRDSRLNAKSI